MRSLVAVLILLSFLQFAQAQPAEITVKEWVIPTPNSAPHDIVVGKNGIVWFTEINANKIGRFDPKTEEFKEYPIPTPSSRPHGLVVDEQGNVWFTEQGASKIGKLDPQTGKIDEYPTPTPNSGPHTPIFGNGVLWFTEQAASKIGVLDMKTGTIREFPTPTASSSPYGIIVDSDGNTWFAELTGHRIGKVDAKTGEVTEYPTPTRESGTRRIAVDSKGKLWFTEYNAGKIGSFDPKTGEMKEYDTSSASSGPYAIWVDIYDNVWFSMTGAYKVGKFDQTTQSLHEYDLPTPRTVIRFIYADHEGNVWFPNNNNNKIGVILANTPAARPEEGTAPVVDVPKSPISGDLITAKLGKQFQLKLNYTAMIEPTNIKVKVVKVTEDTRCPDGAQCVSEGQARILVSIIKNDKKIIDLDLSLSPEYLAFKAFDKYSIRFEKLEPYPIRGEMIRTSDYTATMIVEQIRPEQSPDRVLVKGTGNWGKGLVAWNYEGMKGVMVSFQQDVGRFVLHLKLTFADCVHFHDSDDCIVAGVYTDQGAIPMGIRFEVDNRNMKLYLKTLDKSADEFLFDIEKMKKWSMNTVSEERSKVVLTEGEREGPLLVHEIHPDRVEGFNFLEYPMATDKGLPITLSIGESASNGCTVTLTLLEMDGKTATFLKTVEMSKPCPICWHNKMN